MGIRFRNELTIEKNGQSAGCCEFWLRCYVLLLRTVGLVVFWARVIWYTRVKLIRVSTTECGFERQVRFKDMMYVVFQ